MTHRICIVHECNLIGTRKGYCNKHYRRVLRRGTTETKRIHGDDERRLRVSCMIDDNGCWIWQKHKTPQGYGVTAYKRKTCLAHRVSWMVFRSDIPSDRQINHKCNIKLCINPDHLYLGTKKENTQDIIAAGGFPPRYGERSPMAKLTDEKVKDILKLLSEGWSVRKVTEYYKMSRSAVERIKYGTGWLHISRQDYTKPKEQTNDRCI